MNEKIEQYAEIYAEQEADRVMRRANYPEDGYASNFPFVKGFMKEEAIGVLSILYPIIESDLLSEKDGVS